MVQKAFNEKATYRDRDGKRGSNKACQCMQTPAVEGSHRHLLQQRGHGATRVRDHLAGAMILEGAAAVD